MILHDVRTLLLASVDWQSWCGGLAQATAQTFLVGAPAKAPRPHAILDLSGAITRTRDGETVGRFVMRGGVRLYIAADVLTGGDHSAAMTDYLNRVDAVLGSMELAAPSGGVGTVIDSYALAAGPSRIPAHERDKYGDIYESAWDLAVTVWT